MAKTDVQVTSDAEESAVSVPEKQVREKNIFRVRGMPDIPLLVIILILVGFGLCVELVNESFDLGFHSHEFHQSSRLVMRRADIIFFTGSQDLRV